MSWSASHLRPIARDVSALDSNEVDHSACDVGTVQPGHDDERLHSDAPDEERSSPTACPIASSYSRSIGVAVCGVAKLLMPGRRNVRSHVIWSSATKTRKTSGFSSDSVSARPLASSI